jgi:RNA polymerase sigma-70 factor (ECF subfamily)
MESMNTIDDLTTKKELEKSIRMVNQSTTTESLVIAEDALRYFMDGVVNREASALSALYDATLHKIYGLALKVTRRHDLAEEVVEDTYWQIWQEADKFDTNRGVVIAWMMVICRSRALDLLRRQPHHIPLDESVGDYEEEATPSPVEQMITLERESALHGAMKQLSKVQQQMIALAFFKDMSHQEIANHMHMALGTVKSHIKRAQVLLRIALQNEGVINE